MREEIKNLDTSPKALKRFSTQVGIVAVLLGSLLVFVYSVRVFGVVLIVFGAFVFSLRFLFLALSRYIYIAWMSMAFAIGTVVSTIILVLFFFVVVTPIGIVARVFGKQFLDRTWGKEEKSWWAFRKKRDFGKSSYEKQF